MAGHNVPTIVSTSWLNEHTTDPHVRILEGASYAREYDENNFKSKHIPSSLLFQQWDVGNYGGCIAWPMPDPDKFQHYCQRLGLNSTDHFVLYDRKNQFVCTKLWFTFKALGHDRVSVLDGGLQRWEGDGFPVQSGLGRNGDQKTGDFTVIKDKFRKLFIDFDEMMKVKSTKQRQIVDVRKGEHFRGEEKEPNAYNEKSFELAKVPLPPPFKAGHIPGSLNLCRDDLVDMATFKFKSDGDLRALFRSAKVDITRPTTALCYVGNTACLVPLLYHHLGGSNDVQVYHGSWTEYGQRAEEQDVVTGE